MAVGGIGGGQPTVWTSNDGLQWQPLDTEASVGEQFSLTEVVAGDLGWVILGDAIGHGSRVAWFSTDGLCWQRLPDEVSGRAVAIGSERLVFADHRWAPLLWVGTMNPNQPSDCEA